MVYYSASHGVVTDFQGYSVFLSYSAWMAVCHNPENVYFVMMFIAALKYFKID